MRVFTSALPLNLSKKRYLDSMKSLPFFISLMGCAVVFSAHAETTPSTAGAGTTPVLTAPVVKPVANTAPTGSVAPVTVKPASTPVTQNTEVVTTASPQNAEQPAPPTPVITPEQRRQLELVANAERIDKANQDLLARNQELQFQNENLTIQNSVIQRDKSSEGIWKGALAVMAGFLMGWFFASSRRKSNW